MELAAFGFVRRLNDLAARSHFGLRRKRTPGLTAAELSLSSLR